MPHSKLSLYCLRSLVAMIILGGLPLMLTASHTPTVLEQVQQQGELTIISRNGPTTYYEGNQGLDGYEYSLAKAFADSLGLKLKITEEESYSGIFDSVGSHRGQFAAAGLSITDERSNTIRFTEPYMEVNQELLYRTGSKRPTNIEDLYNKSILVISNSAQAARLRKLQQKHPQLRWHEQSDLEMIDLMEMVHTGTIDFAVIDSNAFALSRNLYPRAQRAFSISEQPMPLAWAFPLDSDNSLFDKANEFIRQAKRNGKLAKLENTHYGQVVAMDTGSATTFARRLDTRLPRWQENLIVAGEEFDLDWQLLAAMSYQESHWDEHARSHTGVRGLMMLTKTTAKEMGVTNRLDPEQSIKGGAKYFRKIFDRIPQDIQGPDRTWFALAAYNIGYGHLEDARVLTEKMGRDPDKWIDVSEHLPLLAKRKHYRTTKHGYARGWEPVAYVQNIRNFYSTIAWHQQVQQRRLASTKNDAVITPTEASFEGSEEQETTSTL
ncbi:membrane-bound lytic murein transglycosylase MltF [Aestuariicella hydrocarbonica]|uniref:Membrane-bound lytic murein transglycosylase F n=1 Tax=Pseudomaricurvus hydrocarbonicus TaxID=1470433 RepID=A0A9E5MPC7_9GAMM|nr:membrane-bound lytic murein transglycosylase MltF [Aestuariicella hydrocarbonica]NHO68008.1 membrane-bound lytic murein transglycosylase MltF [Aestuariicella hydrocarbonica]